MQLCSFARLFHIGDVGKATLVHLLQANGRGAASVCRGECLSVQNCTFTVHMSLSACRKQPPLLIALAANQTSWEIRHLCTEDSSLLQAVLASCCGSISLRFITSGSSSHSQVCNVQTDIITANLVHPNFLREALLAVV